MKCADVREARHKRYQSPGPFTGDEVFIIGAGHFGQRAVDALCTRRNTPLWVVEKDEDALRAVAGAPVERILDEGVPFLVHSFHLLHPRTIIVPAVPIHLACEWLRLCLKDKLSVFRIEAPESMKPLLPHTWEGSEGSLLVSYADFRCPDDCPEPADHCTVTGKKRGTPLHALLGGMTLPEYRIHALRSRQLAPGVGGYRVGDLKELLGRVESGGEGKWLVATACKCHGVVSALEVKSRKSEYRNPKSEIKPKSQCSKLKTKWGSCQNTYRPYHQDHRKRGLCLSFPILLWPSPRFSMSD